MKTHSEEYGIYNQKNLIKKCTFGGLYKSDTASVNT